MPNFLIDLKGDRFQALNQTPSATWSLDWPQDFPGYTAGTIPSSQYVLIDLVTITVSVIATAGNRRPELFVTDSLGNTVFSWPALGTVANGVTRMWVFSPATGAPVAAATGSVNRETWPLTAPLLGRSLTDPPWQLQGLIQNIQVGDLFQEVQVHGRLVL